MPPRQKMTTKMPTVSNDVEAILFVDESKPLLDNPYDIAPGKFVHVSTVGGSKYKSSEVLLVGARGLTLRTSILGPTQAEVSLIPWSAIDGVGLIGAR